jgi:hypothetical protein
METVKTMSKAIFQNKLTTYKANLPSFVKKFKKSLLCGLISQTSAEKPPKNGGVRKVNYRSIFHQLLGLLLNYCIYEIVKSILIKILISTFWESRSIQLIVNGFLD